MLERLPVVPVQVRVGNSSNSLLNEIYQIIYLLYRANKITRKYITIQWTQCSCNTNWELKYLIIIGYHLILQIK